MVNLPPELIEKARAVKSAVLSDDELDNVTGGAGVVNNWHSCPSFLCCFCGKGKTDPQELQHYCESNYSDMPSVCSLCGRAEWKTGVGWVCNL